MSKQQFLSDPWLDQLVALTQEYADKVPAPAAKMRLNQSVTGAPFSQDAIQMHTDTTSGKGVVGRGHLENADITITVDYDTAKSLIVDGDQAAAMQAFMSGKIKVDGDMSKMMVPQPPKNDAQKELDQKIKDMTE